MSVKLKESKLEKMTSFSAKSMWLLHLAAILDAILILATILGIHFIRPLQIYVLTTNCSAKNNFLSHNHWKTRKKLYFATILAAILNISKCSMIPRWHQSDSWKARSGLHEAIKKKSLNLTSRFQKNMPFICRDYKYCKIVLGFFFIIFAFIYVEIFAIWKKWQYI